MEPGWNWYSSSYTDGNIIKWHNILESKLKRVVKILIFFDGAFFHFGDSLFRKRYCVPMVFTTELLRVKIQKQEQGSRKLAGASQVV